MLCVAFAMFVVTPSQYPRLRWQPLLREESKGKDRTRKSDSLNYGWLTGSRRILWFGLLERGQMLGTIIRRFSLYCDALLTRWQ